MERGNRECPSTRVGSPPLESDTFAESRDDGYGRVRPVVITEIQS